MNHSSDRSGAFGVWQNGPAIGSSKMGRSIIKRIQYDRHRVSWLQTVTIKFSSLLSA